jgi:murein DD-endopeptidase MepM/ murein hydrolase activator NlpD
MMARTRRLRLAILLLAAALLGCARTAPPAPVVAGGTPQGARAMRGPQPMVPHPDRVVVRSGETLYAVSRRYGVPVRALIEANGLAPPFRLTAGRSLVVPQVRQHIVQPGDTLYSISRLYGVDTSTLARDNGLQSPYRVWAGEALVLPAPVEKAPVIQATAPAAAFAAPAAARPESPAPAIAAPAPADGGFPTPPPPPPAPRAARTEEAALPAPPPPRPTPAATAAPAAAARAPAPEEKLAALPPPPPPPTAAPQGSRSFIWPVHGRILSGYGNSAGGIHNDGINIAAPQGTPVLAADAGVVAYAGNELRGYGNLVLIKHADGWLTAYAHNSVLLVKRGERVRRGQAIARVGATGAVGAPQLHFEIRHGARALDPADYLPQEAATASRG